MNQRFEVTHLLVQPTLDIKRPWRSLMPLLWRSNKPHVDQLLIAYNTMAMTPMFCPPSPSPPPSHDRPSLRIETSSILKLSAYSVVETGIVTLAEHRLVLAFSQALELVAVACRMAVFSPFFRLFYLQSCPIPQRTRLLFSGHLGIVRT